MYQYVLLINGKWGCGKTYFIRHELKNHLQNKNLKYGIAS
ncbi:P-loop NTPase fold protein [Oribacterium sp. NK2B42]